MQNIMEKWKKYCFSRIEFIQFCSNSCY